MPGDALWCLPYSLICRWHSSVKSSKESTINEPLLQDDNHFQLHHVQLAQNWPTKSSWWCCCCGVPFPLPHSGEFVGPLVPHKWWVVASWVASDQVMSEGSHLSEVTSGQSKPWIFSVRGSTQRGLWGRQRCCRVRKPKNLEPDFHNLAPRIHHIFKQRLKLWKPSSKDSTFMLGSTSEAWGGCTWPSHTTKGITRSHFGLFLEGPALRPSKLATVDIEIHGCWTWK